LAALNAVCAVPIAPELPGVNVAVPLEPVAAPGL
jgi:hypothetical protein